MRELSLYQNIGADMTSNTKKLLKRKLCEKTVIIGTAVSFLIFSTITESFIYDPAALSGFFRMDTERTKPRRTVIARASIFQMGNIENIKQCYQCESKKQNPDGSQSSGLLFSPASLNAWRT
jgi:hypothetical protein